MTKVCSSEGGVGVMKTVFGKYAGTYGLVKRGNPCV